ncbi:MAG: hypothetical protein ACXIUZ_01955 [Lysobacteraceae bacterium]
MKWIRNLFGSASSGVAEGAVRTASGVADIVERWRPSDAAKHEMTQDIQRLVNSSQAEARTYDPRTTGNSLAAEIVNVFVDGLSRLIRPVVTILLVGSALGFWALNIETVDPVILGWTETVLLFWFGGRALFKDLPATLLYLKGIKR